MPRPRLFTAAQVRKWRRLYELRNRLPTVSQMAKRAGVERNSMAQIVKRTTYKTVR